VNGFKWTGNTRVLLCIIAVLLFATWFASWLKYYWLACQAAGRSRSLDHRRALGWASSPAGQKRAPDLPQDRRELL